MPHEPDCNCLDFHWIIPKETHVSYEFILALNQNFSGCLNCEYISRNLIIILFVLKPVSYVCEEYNSLNRHHTHFFLVDDGSVRKFGREIELRARLEKYIGTKSLCKVF